MLKKVSKLAVLLCMIAFAGSTYAQNEVPEYPQYGFWSNWSIGLGPSFIYQMDAKQAYALDKIKWNNGITAGWSLFFQKEIDRGTYARVRVSTPCMFGHMFGGLKDANKTVTGTYYARVDPKVTMDDYWATTVNLVWHPFNSFHSWKPDRPASWYLFGGAGLAVTLNNARGYDNVGTQLEIGTGLEVRLCEDWHLFAETEFDVISNIPNPWRAQIPFHHTDWITTIGVLYNLGITAADRELIAQRALLTKENFDALTAENEAVKEELAQAQNNEKKLNAQIEKLNAQVNNVNKEELARAQRVSDSLNNILDKLKADQLNYYAIPFSVLYANDDWHVSSYEMIKVKAISRVMKDNPDLKLTIVGFCDYTGSDAYNWKLSQKRAEEVKRLMVKKYGIDENRLTVDYKGKTVAFGDINYSLNRRVSFYRAIE